MFPELDEKLQHYVAHFTDSNVVLHDGEDLEDEEDMNMRNSLLY